MPEGPTTWYDRHHIDCIARRDLGVVGVVEPPLLAEDAGVQALAAVVQRHRTTLLDCSARLR